MAAGKRGHPAPSLLNAVLSQHDEVQKLKSARQARSLRTDARDSAPAGDGTPGPSQPGAGRATRPTNASVTATSFYTPRRILGIEERIAGFLQRVQRRRARFERGAPGPAASWQVFPTQQAAFDHADACNAQNTVPTRRLRHACKGLGGGWGLPRQAVCGGPCWAGEDAAAAPTDPD